MSVLLEGKKVTISFGGVKAINALDFNIMEGEIVGIIGPNGAGKTTLLNGISGILPLSSGEIVFEGRRISGVKKAHQITRLGIGRTFQVVRPFEGLTVRENIMVGAVYGRRRAARGDVCEVVEEVMEFVGNADKGNLMVTDLPIAQRKAVEFGRALATQPKLLLLDEVMAGLNSSEIDRAMELVRRVRQRGSTVVLIEHVMKAVMGLCDRVIVLEHGIHLCTGTPQEVCSNEDVICAYLGQRYVEKQRKGKVSSATH